MVERIAWCLALVAAVGCGHKKGTTSARSLDGDVCPSPVAKSRACPQHDCGGNSPVVNGFPINGLANDVCSEGARLVAGSLNGGKCGSGANLVLVEDTKPPRAAKWKLVGKRGDDPPCAEGSDLAGASFTVQGQLDSNGAATSVQLQIKEVRELNEHGLKIEGYRIEMVPPGGGSGSGSGDAVCKFDVSKQVRAALALPDDKLTTMDAPDQSENADADLAIAVPGPIYDKDGNEIGDTRALFSLACVTDALAKRTIYQLDLKDSTSLRMLTANYCGTPFTAHGVEVEWAAQLRPPPDKVEANWKDGKALCIKTPRLMRMTTNNGQTLYDPRQLIVQLQPTGCVNDTGSGAPGKCDEPAWTTALLQDCGSGGKPLQPCTNDTDGDMTSYTVDEGHVQVFKHKKPDSNAQSGAKAP